MAYTEENKANVCVQTYQPTSYGQPVVISLAPPPQLQGKLVATKMVAVRVVVEGSMEQRVCNQCNQPFTKYEIRNGIHIGLLALIIILSCFIFVFVYLFLCLCNQYRVCPNCHKFAGDKQSNSSNICLC
eukprot:TRINITY_DN425_c0_g1_i5.p1 TRINITY_DN425_c0_g1~~TRINITY_DN425_c0_g1_i5.p1  ORF type:complete len:129 (-),score=5.76 TRINITY_DN425_c0_g1_i5:144-530(-)